MQNLRRGYYEHGVDVLPGVAIASAFDEVAGVVQPGDTIDRTPPD